VLGAQPALGEPTARAAAHAVFGLINSTPHSRHLGRDGMATVLREMAVGALTSIAAKSTGDDVATAI
jgi:hypothetical protein